MGRESSKSKAFTEELKVLAHVRSRYNDIFILQNGSLREMWFKGGGDFYLQSRIDLQDPQKLVLVYSRLSMAALLFRPPPRRIFILGMGGGVLPATLTRWFPGVHVDVVEIDRKVVGLCRRFFHLPDSKTLHVHLEDGRRFVERQQGRVQYDLIFLDAFKSGSIPFHLKTVEFYRELKNLLVPDGVLASNLYGPSNTHKPADWKTLTTVFEHLYFFEDPDHTATVAVCTRHCERWDDATLRGRAVRYPKPHSMDFDLQALAGMQVGDLYVQPTARVFEDAFQAGDRGKVIDNNNRLEPVGKIPYSIRNLQ
jgi:spermidine synthase